MTKPILFCTPHAGGSAGVFMRWRKPLADLVTVVPLELPGRGSRIGEALVDDAVECGEDAAASIREYLAQHATDDQEYIILGHSMGSLVAYETYQALSRRHPGTAERPWMPRHMIFPGRPSPHRTTSTTQYHRIADDDEFIDAIDQYGGGTASALRASEELREMFLPVLRADFKLSETYVWDDDRAPVSCSATILNGSDDRSVSREGAAQWEELITGEVEHEFRPGGHFFLYEDDAAARDVTTAAVNRIARKHDNLNLRQTRKATR